MTAPDHDPMGYDDLWGGENFPAHMVNPPDPERSQPLRPAALAAGGALFAVVVVCGVVLVAWATGWMADEVTRVLP